MLRRAARVAAFVGVLLAIAAIVSGCGSSRSAGPVRHRVFSTLLPRRFVRRVADSRGGSMWAGVIPNTEIPSARRPSAVYLPPSVSPRRRYPLVILLHGFRGSPYGYVYGLRFAQIADREIEAHRVPPFIAIMPAAGKSVRYNGEWAGVWERFVVHDVLSWANRHLPVRRGRASRAIGGDSAGGYGAVDIALRHPGLFGTAESWSGYFVPIADGPLEGAPQRMLQAHDPTLLALRESAALRRLDTRFFLSAGSHDRIVAGHTRAFAGELRRLGIAERFLVMPGRHNGRFWRAQLPAALAYALRK